MESKWSVFVTAESEALADSPEAPLLKRQRLHMYELALLEATGLMGSMVNLGPSGSLDGSL